MRTQKEFGIRNVEFGIGCPLGNEELFNYEFRIMLARNAASWLAPSKIERWK